MQTSGESLISGSACYSKSPGVGSHLICQNNASVSDQQEALAMPVSGKICIHSQHATGSVKGSMQVARRTI